MSNVVMDVLTAVENVDKAVERVINNEDQHFPEAATVGDTVRQGDVYIQFIGELDYEPPFYHKLTNPNFPLQLAPGNTKGSRHMLEHSEGIEVWVCDLEAIEQAEEARNFEAALELRNELNEKLTTTARNISKEDADVAFSWSSKTNQLRQSVLESLGFCGPIFNLANPTTVSHPEHGNWILPPGAYRITFQRTIDRDMRIHRVLD